MEIGPEDTDIEKPRNEKENAPQPHPFLGT